MVYNEKEVLIKFRVGEIVILTLCWAGCQPAYLLDFRFDLKSISISIDSWHERSGFDYCKAEIWDFRDFRLFIMEEYHGSTKISTRFLDNRVWLICRVWNRIINLSLYYFKDTVLIKSSESSEITNSDRWPRSNSMSNSAWWILLISL